MKQNQRNRHYVYLDLGFFYSCNFKCAYCRPDLIQVRPHYPLYKFKKQINAFLARHRAAVLKMSGYGEVTLWPYLKDALDFVCPLFPSVQIISNGTFSEKTARILLSYKNVSPNITIDGVTLSANRIRVGTNERIHTHILDNIRTLTEAGRAIEINCVLHHWSMPEFSKLTEWIADLPSGRAILFPMPVRGQGFDNPETARGTRACKAEFEQILTHAVQQFPHIFPNPLYIHEMLRFIHGDWAQEHCKIHWANLGSGSRDEWLHCANYGDELSYGDLTELLLNPTSELDIISSRNLIRGHVGTGCRECFNHFQVINQYLDDNISLDDLCSIPSLAFPGCREIVEKMKAEFLMFTDNWRFPTRHLNDC